MAVNPSALGPKPQIEVAAGTPAVGGRLFFYVAGSVGTKQNTYTDSTGGVANTNPVVLDSLGFPTTTEIWWTAGQSYKVVYAPPGSDDPPNSPIWTVDNLRGINDTAGVFDQWISFGGFPTFINATSFSLVGDQTGTFQIGRRIKTTNTSGTIYSTITNSVFGAVTTVTVVNDSGVFDSGLTAVSYGLLSSTNPAIPVINYAFVVRPNYLVNGDWLLDQINEGALYTVTGGGANVLGPDGWTGRAIAAPGVFKLRTVVDPDFASQKALEITCTTIDAAIGAADCYDFFAALEGCDLGDLRSGLGTAASITIQFSMKFSVTGTYGIAIRNSAVNRSYVGTVTQNVANAREDKIVTLTLDTTGTWLYTAGTVGLYISFTLAAGANFQAAANTWLAGDFRATSAQTNFMSSVANIGYIGRIQAIPGSVALAFGPQDIQKAIERGQRYYEKSWAQGTAVGTTTIVGRRVFSNNVAFAGSNVYSDPFKVDKCSVPTTVVYTTFAGAAGSVSQDDNSNSGATVASGTSAYTVAWTNGGGRFGGSWQFAANTRLA